MVGIRPGLPLNVDQVASDGKASQLRLVIANRIFMPHDQHQFV